MKAAGPSPAVPAAPAPVLAELASIATKPGGDVLEMVTKAKLQAETDAILKALNTTRWNRKRAASMLNIDYKALLYKMKKLGIDDKSGLDSEPEQAMTVQKPN
jgi:DNA-binding NtrC family response regulator